MFFICAEVHTKSEYLNLFSHILRGTTFNHFNVDSVSLITPENDYGTTPVPKKVRTHYKMSIKPNVITANKKYLSTVLQSLSESL